MDLVRHIVHYSCHFAVPFLFARLFWKEHWRNAGLIMVGTMLIDLDHFLADPMCSIRVDAASDFTRCTPSGPH